ncbi:YolD-like family protein [Sulfoacidibacillus thermotolerans]|uniref:YolD-like family protein n=1 Tax=Sulfoacidibacillus thermotolerans TaxID=1765684 RepID=A0A2U3D615_SULT2|nr:YolD-like family protein [Sulfoacidibacillus thermotolerans]PWI56709.1 hypothetical protein BM613_12350 [Sulfoacidibacillus thermotolerans]
MNINDGNIFESMRLVLPEHRRLMLDWKRQRNVRQLPVLSEDEAAQIHYALSEAIANGSRVRVTLYELQGDIVLEGILSFTGQLRIVTEENVQIIDIERLLSVEQI